jgi:hypothetical protein
VNAKNASNFPTQAGHIIFIDVEWKNRKCPGKKTRHVVKCLQKAVNGAANGM